MNETTKVDDCTRLERWLTAYGDNELDAVHALEVEDHLAACEPCREQVAFGRSMRASLRTTRATAPDSLRKRAAAALLAEATLRAEETRQDETLGTMAPDVAPAPAPESAPSRVDDVRLGTTPKLVRLRYVTPLAIAAGVALFAGGLQLRERRELARAHAEPAASTAHAAVQTSSPFDRFLDELIDAHIQPPPPEVTDDAGLTQLDPFVGVRVQRPELAALGAKYLGARMHRREAAMLQYSMGDRRRMTIYVFDPARVPVQANRLQARLVNNNHVYVGHVRGYTVAASERDGVGYAVASDLGDRETEQAIVMAAR